MHLHFRFVAIETCLALTVVRLIESVYRIVSVHQLVRAQDAKSLDNEFSFHLNSKSSAHLTSRSDDTRTATNISSTHQ